MSEAVGIGESMGVATDLVADKLDSRSAWLAFLLRQPELDIGEIALTASVVMSMEGVEKAHYSAIAGMASDRLVGMGFSVDTPRVYVVDEGRSLGTTQYSEGRYEITSSVSEVVAIPRERIGISSSGNTYCEGEGDTHDLWAKIAKEDKASPDVFIALADMKDARQIALE